MRILLTAFEAFGGNDSNISLEVLQALPERDDVRKAVLPVSFLQAPQLLNKHIADLHPDAVVMLGQSGEGEAIRLERYAHNMMDSQGADNDGLVPDELPICAGAPQAYITPLPIKALLGQCRQNGLPVAISNSAGLYVCNRAYFEALHTGQNAIFIHIPKNFDPQTAAEIIQFIISRLSAL